MSAPSRRWVVSRGGMTVEQISGPDLPDDGTKVEVIPVADFQRSEEQASRYWKERNELLNDCKVWRDAMGNRLAPDEFSTADEDLIAAIDAAGNEVVRAASENPESTEEGR